MPVVVYIVQPGDSLYKLAQLFHTTVQDLAQVNGLSEPDLIFPGQRLRIPTGQAPAVQYYSVHRGDTLYTIAQRFGTTVSRILEYNRISNPDMIYPGQVLRLPTA